MMPTTHGLHNKIVRNVQKGNNAKHAASRGGLFCVSGFFLVTFLLLTLRSQIKLPQSESR